MTEDIFISQSRLAMMSRCGEQFRRVYIEGERRPPGVAMIVGSSVDDSVNANLGNVIETGAMLPMEAVQDVARDALEARWVEEGVVLTDEEAELGPKTVRGEAVDRSIRLALLHYDGVAPKLKPKSVQRRFRVRIKGESNIILVGVLDVEEPGTVRDTKTSKKSPAKNAADKSQQLTMYALGVRIEDGEIPDSVHLDYLVDLKTPKYKHLESTRGPDDFRVLLARIERYARIVEAGAFAPANPDDWCCSEKFCGFASTCKFFRKPVSIAIDNSKGES